SRTNFFSLFVGLMFYSYLYLQFFILHELVFGEKNEEVASSYRNVSFTYSGGDVKLIYKRNNLHIKQLDAFCRFLIFLCLRKNT
ncbi:hypothetical protein, partial [Escherichia coli]|uniref:hypothetical protein n=1 Tax=Escherichia coli TaxID=562 RepID=UPI001B8C2DC1